MHTEQVSNTSTAGRNGFTPEATTLPSECSDQFGGGRGVLRKTAIPGSICVVIQCTRVRCSPGSVRTNVGAGVFLFVIRGRSLIYELSSAKTVI